MIKQKNIILLIFYIMILSILITGCGEVYKNTTDQNLEDNHDQSFSAVVAQLDSPNKVYDWMNKNIKYIPDQTEADEFRDPEVTFSLGYGDCDDYAKFADYVLKQHGYQTNIISVYTNEQGHCVCIWEDENGKLNYLSNQAIKSVALTNYEEIAADIYENWQLYAIYPNNEGIPNPAMN